MAGVKIKAGTSFVLPVIIDDPDFDNISAIEFLFKQNTSGRTLKTAYWAPEGACRDAVKKDGEHTILITFSRDDSYLFQQNATFYMDTRVHYTDSDVNPFTKIVALTMRDTLFARGEEVTPDG